MSSQKAYEVCQGRRGISVVEGIALFVATTVVLCAVVGTIIWSSPRARESFRTRCSRVDWRDSIEWSTERLAECWTFVKRFIDRLRRRFSTGDAEVEMAGVID